MAKNPIKIQRLDPPQVHDICGVIYEDVISNVGPWTLLQATVNLRLRLQELLPLQNIEEIMDLTNEVSTAKEKEGELSND